MYFIQKNKVCQLEVIYLSLEMSSADELWSELRESLSLAILSLVLDVLLLSAYRAMFGGLDAPRYP